MSKGFEYTTLAHRYTAKFPVLTYVGTQMNFWIIANILLAIMAHLQSRIIGEAINLPVGTKLGPMLLIALILGVLYGVSLGTAGYYMEKAVFKKLSLGRVILFKAVGSVLLLAALLWFLRFVLFGFFIEPTTDLPNLVLSDASWIYLFYLVLIYYFFMSLIIGFINQVNKKYGPGVLVPLLLGRYRHPKEEERIFMFMDLKSSTSAAELLGHLKYSSFIRDCFADINEALYPYYAQVYQYVGDEIVLMWPEREGLQGHSCIKFYFACVRQFRDRAGHYQSKCGLLPSFKAGMHSGKVTAVEIGELKKEIAYHGDTLNTTARIQSICNDYGKDLLVSVDLIAKIGAHQCMQTEDLGMVLLRGKTEKIGLVSVHWTDEKS